MKGPAVTESYPFEQLPGRSGDRLHVVGQVRGELLSNDVGVASDIWDIVIVPKSKVVKNLRRLKPTPDGHGYYAYAIDLWLGNTGWHGIKH